MREPSRWRVHFRATGDTGPGRLSYVADAWEPKRRSAIREARRRVYTAHPHLVLRLIRADELVRRPA